MTERREALSAAERAELRKRAIITVPVGLGIGAAATWMISSQMGGVPNEMRMLFAVFFGGILLFIVGGHIAGAFEVEKLVRRGVVTAKRVGGRTCYVSLDGEEASLIQWAYQRVEIGQTVEFHHTARLGSIFDVTIVEDPRANASGDAGIETFDPANVAHEEPLSADDRAVLRGHLVRAFIRRVAGGAMLGVAVLGAITLMWVMARNGAAPWGWVDQAIVGRLAPAAGLLAFAGLNLHTYRVVRDTLGESRHVASTGVATAPRSGVVLATGSTAAATVGLDVIDALILLALLGAIGCFGGLLSDAPPPNEDTPEAI